MPDCMMPFPEDWHEFLKDYSFDDSQEVYTNGSRLIPVFRVEQLIKHLLKAQEPRVMTLEEALGSEECWLERKDGNVTVADIALNGQDSGGYDVDSNELSTMRRYIFHSGYYGKYWRCWTSRPTDEQREAIPWE